MSFELIALFQFLIFYLYLTSETVNFKSQNSESTAKLLLSKSLHNRISKSYFHTIFSKQTSDRIWLTVSSMGDRSVRVNWNHVSLVTNCHILITNQTKINWKELKSSDDFSPYYEEIPIHYAHGSMNSKFHLPKQDFVNNMPNVNDTECLANIKATLFCLNLELQSSCIQTESNWWWSQKELLQNRKLRQIAIPGSHDSAAYAFQNVMGKNFTLFPQLPFVLTQDESIFNQLVFGIRYFDLRVNYVPNSDPDKEFWLVHNFVYVKPSLLEILNEIKLFLSHRPNEFIILDFHEISSYVQLSNRIKYNNRLHQEALFKLINYLTYHLNGLIIKNSFHLTLKQLYLRPERIIITYYDEKRIETMFQKSSDYFQDQQMASVRLKYENVTLLSMVQSMNVKVFHNWANQDNLPALINYLNKSIKVINASKALEQQTIEALDLAKPIQSNTNDQANKFLAFVDFNYKDQLFAHMIQMTPKILKILAFSYRGSLNAMAQEVNDVIHELLWKQHQCLNIIASDFVLGNSVVQLTKQFNKLRDTSGEIKCIYNFKQ